MSFNSCGTVIDVFPLLRIKSRPMNADFGRQPEWAPSFPTACLIRPGGWSCGSSYGTPAVPLVIQNSINRVIPETATKLPPPLSHRPTPPPPTQPPTPPTP